MKKTTFSNAILNKLIYFRIIVQVNTKKSTVDENKIIVTKKKEPETHYKNVSQTCHTVHAAISFVLFCFRLKNENS